MVEYILIIIVSLTLIIGTANKLIKPVADFTQNIAGTYVECLLETGELPFIISSKKNSECTLEDLEKRNKKFADSSGSGGSGSGDGDGSNNGDGNGDGDSDANTSDKTASENSSGGGSSGNNSSSSNGFGSGGGSSPSLNRNGGLNETGSASGTGGGSGSSRGDKLASKANRASESGSNNYGDAVPYAFEQDYGRGIAGVLPVKRTEEEETKEILEQSKAPVKSDDVQTDQLRPKSFTAPVPAKKTGGQAQEGDLDVGIEFGKYIRYLIIGGIIFALIIMVFTQLNTLRKSWGGE